jgi:cholesterol oxidase
VLFDLVGSGRRAFSAPLLSVQAPIVILAAGTLGSTEILLRSRDGGLPMSPKLGHGFTGNGDVIALAYNGTEPIDGVGAGSRRGDLHHPIGPCISGMIDLRGGKNKHDGEQEMIIEEGSIPGALERVIPLLLRAAAVFWGRPVGSARDRSVVEQVTRWSRYLAGAHHGAVRRTQILLAMGHDDAGGRLSLVNDRLRVEWPDIKTLSIFDHIHENLRRVSQALQATHVGNPFRLITVHPLGGCGMGDDASTGVVDHEGRVFQGAQGVEPYDGLYVCDGAIIPRSLGVNPLLTIAAVAERTCEQLVRRSLSARGDPPPGGAR